MKITVDRTTAPQGDLVFTITVSEPHHTCFGEIEKRVMSLLDICKEEIRITTHEKNRARQDAFLLIHAAKEKVFLRILDNLKFSIQNEFEPKFKHICQEIYNWIYDNQMGMLKTWMMEFDPQRTRYYFDNDITKDKNQEPQASEHDDEDD